ncbi:hypothetical protein M8818_006246 [Zalaria obscura]|uniref:Uncharacterized protein n=1 Tax=Zalaria obscura TaxID=2024903 RepID=A0ACC3S7F5_9PEZI
MRVLYGLAEMNCGSDGWLHADLSTYGHMHPSPAVSSLEPMGASYGVLLWILAWESRSNLARWFADNGQHPGEVGLAHQPSTSGYREDGGTATALNAIPEKFTRVCIAAPGNSQHSAGTPGAEFARGFRDTLASHARHGRTLLWHVEECKHQDGYYPLCI